MEKTKILTERLIIRNYEEKYLATNETSVFLNPRFKPDCI